MYLYMYTLYVTSVHVIGVFQDQYSFCYRAALEYLGSFDHYAA